MGLSKLTPEDQKQAVDARIWFLRLWFKLTGNCVRFIPGPDGVCVVCHWDVDQY